MAGLTVQESRLCSLQSDLASRQIKNELTKREQVAAMAMQGFIANGIDNNENIVRDSYKIADLFLAHK